MHLYNDGCTSPCSSVDRMNRAVRSHLSFLNFLRTATNVQRKAILQTASREEIDAVSEIVVNILKGVINLSLREKTTLRKYRSALHQIANSSASLKSRKKFLVKINKVLPLALRGILLKQRTTDGSTINIDPKG